MAVSAEIKLIYSIKMPYRAQPKDIFRDYRSLGLRSVAVEQKSPDTVALHNTRRSVGRRKMRDACLLAISHPGQINSHSKFVFPGSERALRCLLYTSPSPRDRQ